MLAVKFLFPVCSLRADLEVFELHPTISIKILTNRTDNFRNSAHNQLQVQRLFLCHIRILQEFVPPDTAARRIFHQWLLQMQDEDRVGATKVTFTEWDHIHSEHM
jgi:hypothetical protein